MTPSYACAIAIEDQPPPHPTSATRPPDREPFVDVGEPLRDPRIHHRHERGAVAELLSLAHVGTEIAPVDATSVAVGGHQGRHLLCDRDRHASLRSEVGEGIAIHEHLGVLRWQRVSALGRRSSNVLDLEQSGGRLLFEPLAGVPLGDTRSSRQFARRRGTFDERRVQPQPVPEVDREDIHRAQQRPEDPLGQRVGTFTHVVPLCVS